MSRVTLLIIIAIVIIVLIVTSMSTSEGFFQPIDYEYNPFRDPSAFFYDKYEFKTDPMKKYPDLKPIKTKYFSVFKNIKPNIGLCGYYDVKKMTRDDALNLCILSNNYGMMSYDNFRNLAYLYPFGNYADGMPIEFEKNPQHDTYLQV